MSHYKDLYKPTSLMESNNGYFRGSHGPNDLIDLVKASQVTMFLSDLGRSQHYRGSGRSDTRDFFGSLANKNEKKLDRFWLETDLNSIEQPLKSVNLDILLGITS